MQAVRKRQEAQDKLIGLLDDEGKAIFSQYEDAAADVTDIARFDTFSEAVKFAVSLMTECLTVGNGGFTGNEDTE